MGKFVNANLAAGETVLAETKLHWSIYLRPLIFLAIAAFFLIGLSQEAKGLGVFFTLLLVPFLFLPVWFARFTSEFAVTNKRVLIKTGFIRRDTLNTTLSKVESMQVEQGVLGRCLGYGSLKIVGTGGSVQVFKNVAGPFAFQKALLEACPC